jgi:hypothetical protein
VGDATSYTANDTAALEGNGGKSISVQILRQAVEAKSRKLQARWTFEAAQDAQSQHGIDVEADNKAMKEAYEFAKGYCQIFDLTESQGFGVFERKNKCPVVYRALQVEAPNDLFVA